MTEMTPETPKNATPDNLKKLARLIRMGQPLQSVAASEAVDLCVAVWAADRARIEALERRDALALKLLKQAPVTVTNWGMEESVCAACGAEVRLSGRIIHKADCAWKQWAALAAKEKP